MNSNIKHISKLHFVGILLALKYFMKTKNIIVYSVLLIIIAALSIIITMAIPIKFDVIFFEKPRRITIDLPSKPITPWPADNEGLFSLGVSLYESNKYEDAKEAFNSYLQYDKKNPLIYYNIGLCYFKIGDYENCINEYKKAIKIDPYYFEAYHNLGLAYGYLNDWFNSIITFEQLLYLNPNDSTAMYNLVLLGYIINNKKLVARYYKTLKLLDPHLAANVDEIKDSVQISGL